MRILITGGGSSGHVIPAFEVMEAIKTKVSDAEFMWIGSVGGMEKELVERKGIPYKEIPAGKLRRYFSLKNISDMFKVPQGILRARQIIRSFKPQVVFSKGGYVSFPVVVAAWLANVPIVSHESDIVPGLANRQASWFVTRIALTYPDRNDFFPTEKSVLTGFPVRSDIFDGSAERARETFRLTDDKPVLLVMGGSQGSSIINKTVTAILPELLKKFQIIHITGPAEYDQIQQNYAEVIQSQPYRVYPYIHEELADAFAVTDVALARSGSTSFELAALGKPSLLIPLANSANDHQQENASYLNEIGVAEVVTEKNLQPHLVYKDLVDILYSVKPETIQANAKDIINRNAANDIADLVLSLVRYGSYKIKE